MPRKALYAATFLLISFSLISFSLAEQQPARHFDGDSWWAHVKFLADDSLEGRDTGSDGLKKAQAYAVNQFDKAGLHPPGSDGFYQPVHLTEYVVDEHKSSLALNSKGESHRLSLGDDAYISTRGT